MFTGIVSTVGQVTELAKRHEQERRLTNKLFCRCQVRRQHHD